MIKNFKTILKKNYKFLVSKLFILFYGSISKKVDKSDFNLKIQEIKIEDNLKYSVYFSSKSRLYTDRIHNTAIIINNKIVEGASFQLKNNKNKNVEENVVFSKGTPNIKKNIKGVVMSTLTGGGGNSNYWHWMFDVLPRLFIIQKLIELDEIDFFLFPDLKEKFQNQTLDLLNIPKHKRLSSKSYKHFSADQIIATDHPYNLLNDPKKDSLNIPIWLIESLKNNFKVNQSSRHINLPKRIYIDRSDSFSSHGGMRSIINEEEVRDFLKKKNFEFLTLSKYDFIDQVRLFNNAECVIGLHGAGFANTIFCRPGTRILELRSEDAGIIIKNLSKKNKLTYECIHQKPKTIVHLQLGDIEIPINILKDKLKQFNL
ncbi:MAG: glycosyltransferase family 61 protein [Pelagibacteraceae bacterium]